MTSKDDSLQSQAIHDEIKELEDRLKDAKDRLKANSSNKLITPPSKLLESNGNTKFTFNPKLSNNL